MSGEKLANVPEVGSQIRNARQQRALTIQQLSVLSGVSSSAISKIENGKASASFDTLISLSHALAISFEALFGKPQAPSTALRAITREADLARFSTDQYDYEVHAQELANKKMIPLVMEITNRVFDSGTRWSAHPGEEFIYIVCGELNFHTEMYTPTRLKAGESVYIDSGMPHAFVSISDDNAKIVSVCLDGAAKSTEAFVIARTKTTSA